MSVDQSSSEFGIWDFRCDRVRLERSVRQLQLHVSHIPQFGIFQMIIVSRDSSADQFSKKNQNSIIIDRNV